MVIDQYYINIISICHDISQLQIRLSLHKNNTIQFSFSEGGEGHHSLLQPGTAEILFP